MPQQVPKMPKVRGKNMDVFLAYFIAFSCSVGPGYPCRDQENGYEQHCDKCKKTFTNDQCYNAHRTPYKPGKKTTCDKNHFCVKCGVNYELAVKFQFFLLFSSKLKNQPEGVHVCGRTYCRLCGSYHMRNGHCHMRYNEKRDHPKRFIL